MRYLEEIYNLYKQQKENPILDIQDSGEKEVINLSFNKSDKEITQNFEFGEIYYFLTENRTPVFFMINGKIEESKKNLYSVYKVSDFIDFATQEDFLFELNGLPYMVETWNEFYLYEDDIKEALFLGKLSEEEISILENAIDGISEIPEERRGLTIPDDENSYIQNRFKEDELNDVLPYKTLIFKLFEDIGEKEVEFIIELPPERLENQPLAAAEEIQSYTGENFVLFLNKDKKILILEPFDEVKGKKGTIKVFNKEYKVDGIPEEIYLRIPEEIKDINLIYIGGNITIEV